MKMPTYQNVLTIAYNDVSGPFEFWFFLICILDVQLDVYVYAVTFEFIYNKSIIIMQWLGWI